MSKWKVGDRVSFAASLSWNCGTVYTGTIERIEGGLAYVRDDGWQAISAVAFGRLHPAGTAVSTAYGRICWSAS